MEAYRGLAILATNMKSALDTAFMRRLRFIVNFPFPGPERAPGDLGESLSGGDADGGDWTTNGCAPQPDRRQHPQHRPQRRVSGGQAGTPVTMPLILRSCAQRIS